MSVLLQIDSLTAGYGAAVVLDAICARVESGQTLALLGRNGVGKTTLLNTIMGLTSRHAGSILWRGQALDRLRPHQRALAGIGWVPQERNIFGSLTVHENLTAVQRPGPWGVAQVYALFPRLAQRRSNLGTELSGGEQQMLAVARALVLNPALILLDEPFEGLAPIIIDELAAAIERITRGEGLAAIIVEQHPQQVLAMSDRALVLDQGRVVHEGAADALLADPVRLEGLLGVSGP